MVIQGRCSCQAWSHFLSKRAKRLIRGSVDQGWTRVSFQLRLATNCVTNAPVHLDDIIVRGYRENLTRNGNELYLAGQPFRRIGLNIPDLFHKFLGIRIVARDGQPECNEIVFEPDRPVNLNLPGGPTPAELALNFLQTAAYGFDVVRFGAIGVLPDDMRLYAADEQAYWAAMDRLITAAKTLDIRLIPSFTGTPFCLLIENWSRWGVVSPVVDW